MFIKKATALLLLAAVAQAGTADNFLAARRNVIEARQNRNNNNKNNNNNNNNGGNNALALNPNNVQTGSQQTGQNGTDVQAGQVNSATDPANFINFCTGKTLTNGLQVKTGSCNGIVMGDIPSTENMISSMFVFPVHNQNLAANTDFTVKVQVNNLVAGSFTNAQATYYSAPQQLQGGKIVGHCHITCQAIGSLTSTTPPDPKTFAFFKGINDNGNGQGELSATVTGGLPAGAYRCCTMNSASNHQPVLMPVAQRGTQDDCVKFTVGGGATNNNANNNNNNNNANANTGNGTKKAATTKKPAKNTKTTTTKKTTKKTGTRKTGAARRKQAAAAAAAKKKKAAA
ncbi:hypothetical protein TWF694_005803 [Orbilia ellipsospora]|uniref:Ribosomal protein s17 n=1 Tax=Orbilia ellipsospora TaxID=2528407 RepID=A0AAV9WTD3_9PEZI